MNWTLFLLGMFGALLVTYIAQSEPIPEFRPLFDVSDDIADAKACSEDIACLRKFRASAMKFVPTATATVAGPPNPPNGPSNTSPMTCTECSEVISKEEKIKQGLQRTIHRSQYISRGLGFLIYVVMGGVLAGLLTEHVQISLTSTSAVPDTLKAFLIGATWISYLTVIGIQATSTNVDSTIKSAKDSILSAVQNQQQQQEADAQSLAEKIKAAVSGYLAGQSQEVQQPMLDAIESQVSIQSLESAKTRAASLTNQVRSELDVARAGAKRRVRGIL